MGKTLRLSLISACLLQASSAAACVRINDLYTVGGATPGAMDEAVPLNAPLVIDFNTVHPQVGAVAAGYNMPGATLQAIGNDFIHKLRAVELGTLDDKRTAFVDDTPLLPDTQYSIVVGEDTEFPADLQAPAVTWTFTTGTEARPPLRLKGDMGVTFEAGTDPHYVCKPLDSICGPQSTCQEMGTDRVTKARVQLPAAWTAFPNSIYAVSFTQRQISTTARARR